LAARDGGYRHKGRRYDDGYHFPPAAFVVGGSIFGAVIANQLHTVRLQGRYGCRLKIRH